jgi:hypothetical protein
MPFHEKASTVKGNVAVFPLADRPISPATLPFALCVCPTDEDSVQDGVRPIRGAAILSTAFE